MRRRRGVHGRRRGRGRRAYADLARRVRRRGERREVSRLYGGEAAQRRRRASQAAVERALLREATRPLGRGYGGAHVGGRASRISSRILPSSGRVRAFSRRILPRQYICRVVVERIPRLKIKIMCEEFNIGKWKEELNIVE